jgi:hypothetical protein
MGRRLKYQNRDEVVARMRQPGAPSIGVLSEETGVPKATLYAWLRLAGGRSASESVEGLHMGKSKGRIPSSQMAWEGCAAICTTHRAGTNTFASLLHVGRHLARIRDAVGLPVGRHKTIIIFLRAKRTTSGTGKFS